ncbi:hypothetical protein pipiens_019443, partial [Culex pipiens pipiens]
FRISGKNTCFCGTSLPSWNFLFAASSSTAQFPNLLSIRRTVFLTVGAVHDRIRRP